MIENDPDKEYIQLDTCTTINTISKDGLNKDSYDSIIFTLDTSLNFVHGISTLISFINNIAGISKLHVFLHKMDLTRENERKSLVTKIKERINEQIRSHGIELLFHQTSIFDGSIWMAFSLVIQGNLPFLNTIEYLLDNFCTLRKVEKVLVFDMKLRIFLASDPNPLEDATFADLLDLIDMTLDFCHLYFNNVNLLNDVSMQMTCGTFFFIKVIKMPFALVYFGDQKAIDSLSIMNFNIDQLMTSLKGILNV